MRQSALIPQLLLALGLTLSAASISAGAFLPIDGRMRGVVLSDFESGQVELESYGQGQDLDPNGWSLTSQNTYGGSSYALRISGNSWKAQPIAPYPITGGTVLRVALYVEELGEMQAFGISDGASDLLYTVAGAQLPEGENWDVAYQGAYPTDEWIVYDLPVGRDWHARYGDYPEITKLVYINDHDATSSGVTIFDLILDATEDLPVPPDVEIVTGRQAVQRLASDLYRVGVQFHAQVEDPDSDSWLYHWDFGDSSFSDLADPFHEFLVTSDHTYTVTLAVQDMDGMWGRDSAQVRVDPGVGEPRIRMNFVGDVMLARGYDQPGGIIDQYGPEYVFEATREMLSGSADVTLCNLECPFTDEGEEHPTKSYVFRARPENIAGITYAGFDVVSLGNNHIIDYGQRGMEETREILDAERIRYTGAGDNEYIAFQPAFWNERGTAVAFLGMCNRTGREYNYQPFLDAAASKPGFAYLIEPRMSTAILAARPLADFVVMQLHAGIEYSTGPGSGLEPKVEPDYDAQGPTPGMIDFSFPTRPSETDRELRYIAVDAGADLVICHHPHVLQGFEVYNGVLIVHSLGNFAFDQSFAETMPSILLTTEFDKAGFNTFECRPIFIDNMIPKPASGRLGREILDRQAEYSRELNQTIVAVDPAETKGTIYIDPAECVWSPEVHEARVAVGEEDGFYVSAPIERRGLGTLGRILAVEGSGSVELRVGREILWHGGFEDEGATFWRLENADEVYDEAIRYDGERSLRQHRRSSNSGSITTDLEGYPPILEGDDFSVCGWVRSQAAVNAGIAARFFATRGGSPVGAFEVTDAIDGTQEWTYYTRNFTVPEEAKYMNVRLHMDKPPTGESYAWYDEVKLIQWEAWVAAELPAELPSPSNLRFIQIRQSSPGDSARVVWEDLLPSPAPSSVADGAPSGSPAILAARILPSPFRDRTAIEYSLPRAGRVRVEIYDISGRRVSLLEDATRSAGRHRIDWEAADLPSGLYLCRIESAASVQVTKIVRLR